MASKTARTLITDAMQDIGVVADQEAMTDTQGNYGLRKLNDLMGGFDSEGIAYAHTDLATLDAIVNVPDGQLRNVGLMLQREIASPYGVTLSDDDKDQIHKAKMALQAYYYVPITGAPEMALRRRQFGRFNYYNS